MEIKLKYHQTGLDIYLNDNLAIEGIGLISYEIENKNGFDQLIEKTSLKISLTKPDNNTVVFEFLEIGAKVVMGVIETSQINIVNAKKVIIHHENIETLVY